jgi:hypothetical protein
MSYSSKVRTSLCVLSLLVAGNTTSSAPQGSGVPNPTPTYVPIPSPTYLVSLPDGATHMRGDAVAGVDSLGRALIAVDKEPVDGFAYHYILFTAENRLAPSWSRYLEEVQILFKNHRVTLVSRKSAFAMSLTLLKESGKREKEKPIPSAKGLETYRNRDGIELAQYYNGDDEPGSVPMAGLSAEDVHSGWPPAMYDDLLAESQQ